MNCKDCVHSFVCWKSMQVEKDNLPCSDFADRSLYVVREKGEWVFEEVYPGVVSLNGYMCSKCRKNTAKKTDFCPNCGADMRKEAAE